MTEPADVADSQFAALAQLAADALIEGIVLQTEQYGVVWANETACTILGASREYLMSVSPTDPSWSPIRSDGTPWGTDHASTRSMATGQSVSGEVRGIKRPDGTLVWLSVSTRPVTLPDGSKGVVIAFVDITEQRATEARLRVLFDHSGAPTVVLDFDTGLLLDVNGEMSRWLGYERSELIGRHGTVLIHPDDHGTLPATYFAQGQPDRLRIELRFIHRDGTERWGLVNARGLPSDIPGRRPVIIQAMDITEQKTASRALEAGRMLYRDTVEAMVDPLFLWTAERDEDGAIEDFTLMYINTAGGQALHLEPADIIGRRLLELFPSMGPSGRFQQYCSVVETGQPLLSEVPKPDEVEGNKQLESHIVKSGDGVVIVARDVTTRIAADTALRQSEHQYRLLADNAGDVVILVNDDTIEWIAPSVQSLLGWMPEDLLGLPLGEIVHPDDRALLDSSPGVVGDASRLRLRMRRRDGAWLWVDKHSRRLRPDPSDAAGRSTSTVCTVWNVQPEVDALNALADAEQERLNLERRMQQAARMESMGVLAGGVAHDFNNLLVGILGNTELVLSALEPESEHRPLLRDVQAAAERAAGLTRQLLAYARQGPMATQAVDLSSLVLDTLPLVRSMVSESATLLVDAPAGLPRAQGDPDQLAQVIMNLVINAAEALVDRRGQVSVRTAVRRLTVEDVDRLSPGYPRPDGIYVCLHVTDTGHGMSAQTLAQIYEPFFTTRFPGRGLGLAAVHGIVHSHGGIIETESAPDRGTTFRVYLPASPT